MTESEPTGYRDSPDTTDVDPGAARQDGPERDDAEQDGAVGNATLTTDDSAQSDDGVVRPGNEAD